MKEVEILVEVKSDKENVMKALAVFESGGIKRVLDIYFFDPSRKDLKPDKNNRLRASLRIRKKGDKASVTYKKDYFEDNDEWIYSDEHETAVEDFDMMVHIFELTGLKELVRVENEKYIFYTPEYEVVFEDVKGLGYFLEVELLHQVSDDEVGAAKEKIRSFIRKLGIEVGKELNAGKPELMLRELHPS